jgi:hypothetical protein
MVTARNTGNCQTPGFGPTVHRRLLPRAKPTGQDVSLPLQWSGLPCFVRLGAPGSGRAPCAWSSHSGKEGERKENWWRKMSHIRP